MDLRPVEYVLAIVDHGGFTRAAEALHVAQPSLSQSVRKLERELGAPLFDRIGRRAVLTDAGEAFLGPARQLLRDRDAVRASVAAVAALETGVLDVVSLPTLVAEPLAGLVGAFRRQYPGVAVRIAEPDDRRALAAMVADGRSEVGLAELPVAAADLVEVRLERQELFAALPPGTKRPAGGRLRIEDLARRPLVTSPPHTSTRDLIDGAFQSIGATPEIAVETEHREALVPLVLRGAGVALVAGSLARHAEVGGAVVVPLTPRLTRTIGLVHRGEAMSPAAREFLRIATDVSRPAA